jgi:putative membrane protein
MNAPLVLGLLTLVGVWLVLPLLAAHSFAVHMIMHMGVVALAAPLLALGLARSAHDPVRRAPRWFAPIPASLIELAVVWVWHAPALHHAARHLAWARALEQGSFLASGLLLWLAVLGGDERTRDTRRGGGILALLLTSMHMTLLGALLALPPRALYVHGEPAGALADQHWGGAIMLVVGGIVYLLGGLALTAGLLRTPRAESVS